MARSSSVVCLYLNTNGKIIAITKAYPAKLSHMPCQFLLWSANVKNLSIRKPLSILPKKAPNPFTIIINKPCALALISGPICVSTNNEPDILKKSNAMPYTMHDKIIIHSPPAGSPKAKSPNLKTHASMLINITYLIPNFRRTKGIARMKSVSDTCDIDMIIAGYFIEIV
jgi:hypothetical protein